MFSKNEKFEKTRSILVLLQNKIKKYLKVHSFVFLPKQFYFVCFAQIYQFNFFFTYPFFNIILLKIFANTKKKSVPKFDIIPLTNGDILSKIKFLYNTLLFNHETTERSGKQSKFPKIFLNVKKL